MKNCESFKAFDSYGWSVYSPNEFKKKIDALCRSFNRLLIKPDAIAFQGSSGSAIAFPLSYKLKVPIIYIRKPDEHSHGHRLEGNIPKGGIATYVIVDDLISSGATIQRIYTSIADRATELGCKTPKCTGVFLYSPNDLRKVVIFDYHGKNKRLPIITLE